MNALYIHSEAESIGNHSLIVNANGEDQKII